MKLTFRKTIILSGALAMLAGPALAQQGPQQGPPPGQTHDQNHGQQYEPHPPPPGAPPHQAENGPPHGGWHEGEHYNGNRVVVEDWGHHHLRQPPPGYEWVQSDNQFVMIAVTTGVIASIIVAASAQ